MQDVIADIADIADIAHNLTESVISDRKRR